MERKRKKLGIKYPREKSIDENKENESEPITGEDPKIEEDIFEINIENEFDETEEIDLTMEEEAEENLFEEISTGDIDFGDSIEEEDKIDTEIAKETKPASKNNNTLIVDPETTYVFVFGEGSAGKSVMMSGLIRYLDVHNEYGSLHGCCDNSAEQKRGDKILDRMREKVSKGEYVDRTEDIDNTENIFSTEINLEFVPNDSKKPTMPFCVLEMSGEDLKQIGPQHKGELDSRISGYLHHPDCNILFICVVDPNRPQEAERLINRFLDYTRSIGREENPILVSVNKWDQEKDKFNNDVNSYFKQNIPILNRSTQNSNRDYSRMGFSIGKEIDQNHYIYNPKDSEVLFKWIYKKATGEKIEETKKRGFWNKLSKLKN